MHQCGRTIQRTGLIFEVFPGSIVRFLIVDIFRRNDKSVINGENFFFYIRDLRSDKFHSVMTEKLSIIIRDFLANNRELGIG